LEQRSKKILELPKGAKVRATLKAMGYSDYDLERPLIGIANSWTSLVPGHFNLRQLAESVKQGVYQGGGTPVEFGVIAGCDSFANIHEGGRFMLPSRGLIADSIEIMAQVHQLDGLVLLGSCDKIVPGLLMGAARVNIPAIFVNGGPSLGGCEFDGRPSDLTSINEALGMLLAGKLSEKEFLELENKVMPTCGSCSFLGTANSMCCLAEAIGMSLPGCATIPAVVAARMRVGQESGRRIVGLIREGLNCRKVITEKSVENACRVVFAMGGSTNIILHLTAIAYEAGIDLGMDFYDRIAESTPHLAKVFPAAPENVVDFHNAGGVPALMREILPLLNGDTPTVSGKSVRENLQANWPVDHSLIKSMKEAWSTKGAFAVLWGNLAPKGSISKPAVIDPAMHKFTGKARCFDSQKDANQAISQGEVQAGEVVVIRYEGPKGAPGMPEMSMPSKLLYGRGLSKSTAMITDGRFSGTNNGCFVGHISPEAFEGGPLAAVRNGDLITIDIPNKEVKVNLDEQEMNQRLAEWQRPPYKASSGYLNLFARLAESADKGAIIPHRG